MRTVKYTYLGLDLSQATAALAVIDLVETIGTRRDPVTFAFDCTHQFSVRSLTRFPEGTPLTGIPALVRELGLQPPPEYLGPRLESAIALDPAGRGIAVLELLRKADLTCGILTVAANPRRELAGLLRLAIRSNRLVLPQDLPLQAEFEALDPVAGQTANDDKAVAVALALWASSRRHPGLLYA